MFGLKSWHWGAALFTTGIIVGGWLVAHEDRVASTVNEVQGAFGVRAALAQSENATPKPSPVKASPRDVYYPNSEDLAPDEIA